MSCCLSGPTGLFNVPRTAAFRPGSGMMTSWAETVATKLINAIIAMA
jgi:hypothetical protein